MRNSIMTTENRIAVSTLPAPMPRLMVLLLAAACGLSVANVYYAQPLLDALSADFGIGTAAIGGVMTATQVGCALALLLLVPLGDLVNRRHLMLAQLGALTAALIAVALATTPLYLLAGMLAVGMLGTAMTQGLIAYAATAAAPQERGRVVGAAQGGVVIGLLLARVMAGIIADLAGWRGVYLFSALLMLLLAVALWRALPHQARPARRSSYPAMLLSMLALLREERTLQIRGVIALLMFAALNIFWSALVLPLSAAPYYLSHTAIGAFGLVGILGALAAVKAGDWADKGRGQWVSGGALLLLLAAWLPLGLTSYSLYALTIGIIALDLGAQAVHVANQNMIFNTRPDAHSRLVGCYMLFYSVGSGLGAMAATMVYASAGWAGVCLLGAAVSLSALVFWGVTLSRMPVSAPSRS
ncbi:MFS transporter [Brenneria nigrifluens]|uniref:MFS transporter n=2 Tax=Pectobacteriaceae TaxID=1903410 RepID=A0A2U1UIU8_9GAMM|nr:MFS transporter [Brenneria nigrifluens] [Brenneria nigrifluens DSM 30175 = ATCC 13028]QCR06270.1 MFS transporter [Brenneria nigrifluens] [Brenneria nigrifluens DSM 30175 = ATCC 13028]